MPPFLCLPPSLLDHSFPCSEDALRLHAACLGDVSECVLESQEAVLVRTAELQEAVERICWSDRPQTAIPILREIYRHLLQLMTAQGDSFITLELPVDPNCPPHPIPGNPPLTGALVDTWASALGRLLQQHDSSQRGTDYCLGIACGMSFDGHSTTTYLSHPRRAFPVVGRIDIATALIDGYGWDEPSQPCNFHLSFRDIQSNFAAIGGVSFDAPKGDSHYKLVFPNGDTWTCDRNWGSDIGDNVIDELKRYTGMPLSVIKTALRTGRAPRRVSRFEELRVG